MCVFRTLPIRRDENRLTPVILECCREGQTEWGLGKKTETGIRVIYLWEDNEDVRIIGSPRPREIVLCTRIYMYVRFTNVVNKNTIFRARPFTLYVALVITLYVMQIH